MNKQRKKKISIIVPVYNEQDAIKSFLDQKLLPEIKHISDYYVELILINDGSSDKTLPILQSYAKNNSYIKVISFARNFGKEAALSAALIYATGDVAIFIDADGQHPPQLIPEFIAKWEKTNAHIIVGLRDHYSKHGLIQRIGSKLFYKLLSAMGNKNTIPGSTDYRLIDRVVIDDYNQLTEHNRITRGLIDWLGYPQEFITYTPSARMAGKPSYNIKKLFKLAINSFISMSTTPLVIFGYIGIFITIASFLLGVFVIINQFILGDPLHLYWNGAVQMSILISFLVGLVLISQAITALYISHIHAETQGRPLYIIDKHNSRNINQKEQ